MEIVSIKEIGNVKLYLISYYGGNTYHIAKEPAHRDKNGKVFLVEQFTANRAQAIKHFNNLLG